MTLDIERIRLPGTLNYKKIILHEVMLWDDFKMNWDEILEEYKMKGSYDTVDLPDMQSRSNVFPIPCSIAIPSSEVISSKGRC